MSKDADLARMLDSGLVAIIRAPSGEQLLDVTRALYEGGVDIVEVTFTVPGAVDIIKHVNREMGDKVLLGAGTVLDPETARAALLAGAAYIVTPVVNVDVIRLCRRYDKICLVGAFTPTEILSAWEAGADIVRVFPADVGGPGYLKAIHGPLPHVRLLPTGGVDLDTLASFVQAGACAVGLGSALVEKEALANRDMDRIRRQATAFVEKMKAARLKS